MSPIRQRVSQLFKAYRKNGVPHRRVAKLRGMWF